MEEQQKVGNITIEEFQKLGLEMEKITTRIPDSMMPYVWDMYLRVTGTQEPRPCGCQSAAGLWIRAIDTLKKFVTDNAGIQ
jgi:hypothetical protein